MQIAPPLRPVTMNRPRPAQLETFFRKMKESNVGLVVVVVPDKDNKDSYGKMLIKFYTKPPLLLIVSMITINGISVVGVSWGTR